MRSNPRFFLYNFSGECSAIAITVCCALLTEGTGASQYRSISLVVLGLPDVRVSRMDRRSDPGLFFFRSMLRDPRQRIARVILIFDRVAAPGKRKLAFRYFPSRRYGEFRHVLRSAMRAAIPAFARLVRLALRRAVVRNLVGRVMFAVIDVDHRSVLFVRAVPLAEVLFFPFTLGFLVVIAQRFFQSHHLPASARSGRMLVFKTESLCF